MRIPLQSQSALQPGELACARMRWRESAPSSGLILSGATSGREDERTRGREDFYFTPRARPGDTPEVFARVLPAAVFLGATFARRRGLRPACAEALERARAPPAGR